ncbi:alpha/beta fold hydrolase [Kribbella sp. NPDC050820]|uniref:alpha/beta fold hydrolase n=1 Tax=Kribbella sp. NPDC050820 TaxID=3155408 RepID=UPI0033E81E87
MAALVLLVASTGLEASARSAPADVAKTPLQESATLSTLQPSACASQALTNLGAKCYEFTAPENWDNPTGRTVRLPVAVVSNADTDPNATPVFNMPGGPGGSGHMTSENGIRSQLAELAPHRLVLVGNRGLEIAEPALLCNGMADRRGFRQFSPDVFGIKGLRQRIDQYAETVSACYQKLKGEGIDPTQYTDYHIARDYDEIREALGFDKIDLFGGSTGGGTVATYITYHGAHVRSAIMRSPWFPALRNRSLFDLIIESKQYATDILSVCVRDNEECASRFPDYLMAIDRARAILDKKPYVTSVASEVEPGGRLNIRIDGATFLTTLYMEADLNLAGRYNQLPKALEAIERGDYAALDDYFGLDDVDTRPDPVSETVGGANGHRYANLCGSMGKNRPTPEETIAMIEREPALLAWSSTVLCAWWGEDSDVPPSLNTLPASDVPVLAIHGQLDPCCGTRTTDFLAQSMPNLQRVVLQAQGHGAGGACRRSVIAQFLESPNEPVDDSCKNDQPLRPWVFYGN